MFAAIKYVLKILLTSGVQGLNSKPTLLSPCYKMLIFKFQLPTMFLIFVFRKIGLINSCLYSDDLSEYKISWSYVGWCKFHTHLKSLNVRHFGMVAATALKLRHRGHLQWHDLPTKFQKIYQLVQRLRGVGHRAQTETETDRMAISLA
jgi:hypothetical protein